MIKIKRKEVQNPYTKPAEENNKYLQEYNRAAKDAGYDISYTEASEAEYIHKKRGHEETHLLQPFWLRSTYKLELPAFVNEVQARKEYKEAHPEPIKSNTDATPGNQNKKE